MYSSVYDVTLTSGTFFIACASAHTRTVSVNVPTLGSTTARVVVNQIGLVFKMLFRALY